MNISTISEQLQHDYPEHKIHLDTERRMVVVDNHKMSLLNSTSALENMNIFSRSGKSFYQAIVYLLYSNFNLQPRDGSYASSLIILKEDLNRYKLQKLAKKWGIGFLEDKKDVLALEVDDGIERELLLESNEAFEELQVDNNSPKPEESLGKKEADEWAELEEMNFNTEIAYLEKGIEFFTELEKLENRSGQIGKKDKIIQEEVQKNKLIDKRTEPIGIINFIQRLFKK